MSKKPRFTFIDLFAGIGGFHAVGQAMGGICVYAAEIDSAAAAVYKQNWEMDPLKDLTLDANDEVMNVPIHDVLFAGFPCQPFSKSGAQKGMEETRGTLFWNIARIVQVHRPAIVILENVRNLAGPRHAHELAIIVETLKEFGYRVSESPAIMSPHLLPPSLGGRPQVRERVFITATYVGEGSPDLDTEPVFAARPLSGWDASTWDLESDLPLIDGDHIPGTALSSQEELWINAWDEFVSIMWEAREGRRLPGFPLWADEWVTTAALEIPVGTASWKADFLRKNSEFYTAHQVTIDQWTQKWEIYSDVFPPSRRKLEWQAQDTPRLWDCVMHFRPSGIRAKRATYLPALVAITQTSIIGPRRRKLSTREAARLQGLPDWFSFDGQTDAATYRQLGNGVSIGVVWQVLRAHARRDEEFLKRSAPKLLEAVLSSPDSPDAILSKHNLTPSKK